MKRFSIVSLPKCPSTIFFTLDGLERFQIAGWQEKNRPAENAPASNVHSSLVVENSLPGKGA
jgi:hypothetical protein